MIVVVAVRARGTVLPRVVDAIFVIALCSSSSIRWGRSPPTRKQQTEKPAREGAATEAWAHMEERRRTGTQEATRVSGDSPASLSRQQDFHLSISFRTTSKDVSKGAQTSRLLARLRYRNS